MNKRNDMLERLVALRNAFFGEWGDRYYVKDGGICLLVEGKFDEKRLKNKPDVFNISEHVIIHHLGRYVASQRYMILEIEKFLLEWEKMESTDES